MFYLILPFFLPLYKTRFKNCIEKRYNVCVYVLIFKTHIHLLLLFGLLHIENMFPTKYKLDIIIKHISMDSIYS